MNRARAELSNIPSSSWQLHLASEESLEGQTDIFLHVRAWASERHSSEPVSWGFMFMVIVISFPRARA